MKEALNEAKNEGLDLVEINANQTPPVCKIMDYSKYLFDEKKLLAQQKKKQKQVHLKEMKFSLNTDVADFNIKAKKMIKFLEDGNKAKMNLRFKGREIEHPEKAFEILKRLENSLESVGVLDSEAKIEGRQLSATFAPIKK